jgi:hypothetical protein
MKESQLLCFAYDRGRATDLAQVTELWVRIGLGRGARAGFSKKS